MDMLHIEPNGSQNVATISKYFAHRPPPNPRGQKVKIQLFQNNVILHIEIKGIRKCSNMVANVLPADPPDPGVGLKGSKFHYQNMVIKGSKECSNMVANIVPAAPFPHFPNAPRERGQ